MYIVLGNKAHDTAQYQAHYDQALLPWFKRKHKNCSFKLQYLIHIELAPKYPDANELGASSLPK